MLQFLDGAAVAVEAKLIRAAHSKTILVVEGDSDYKVFRKFFDSSKCYLLPARGRENVLDAITMLDEEAFAGVVGIVDADFWHIDGTPDVGPNLLLTDFHDLEVMMLNSSALDGVLSEIGSSSKTQKFFSSLRIKTIKTWIHYEGEHLGRLRLIATRHKIPLKFKELKFKKFVSKDNVRVDKKKCLTAILSQTANPKIVPKEVGMLLAELTEKFDRRQVCCGHDLTQILAFGLRKAWGTNASTIADVTHIEKLLRMAYSREDFEQTALYNKALNWQLANRPYELIR